MSPNFQVIFRLLRSFGGYIFGFAFALLVCLVSLSCIYFSPGIVFHKMLLLLNITRYDASSFSLFIHIPYVDYNKFHLRGVLFLVK